MTKEELKQEAEEWLDNERKYLIEDNEGNLINISKKVKEAYLASAEPREKQIEELKAQIEKMKQELDTAREEANRQEQWEFYSILNGIYHDNFEVITSVSN